MNLQVTAPRLGKTPLSYALALSSREPGQIGRRASIKFEEVLRHQYLRNPPISYVSSR